MQNENVKPSIQTNSSAPDTNKITSNVTVKSRPPRMKELTLELERLFLLDSQMVSPNGGELIKRKVGCCSQLRLQTNLKIMPCARDLETCYTEETKRAFQDMPS